MKKWIRMPEFLIIFNVVNLSDRNLVLFWPFRAELKPTESTGCSQKEM